MDRTTGQLIVRAAANIRSRAELDQFIEHVTERHPGIGEGLAYWVPRERHRDR